LLVKNEYAAQLVIDSLEKAVQGETTFRSTVAIPYGHSLDNYKSLVKANIATADKLLELNRKDFRALISKSAYQKAVTDGLVSDSSQYHRQLLGEINRRRTSISRLLTEIPIRYTLLRDIFKQAKTVLSQYDTAVAGRDRSSIIRCALTTGQSHSSLTQYVNRVESANLMVDKYRDLLTNRNLKLLAKIALVLETSQHSADSNFSHGFLGLIKAVDGFDLTRGFRFTSYASRAILNAIIRGRSASTKTNGSASLN
jgi:DNA-directed RNA polymerase sigma subunit (sigma70/sigma32)